MAPVERADTRWLFRSFSCLSVVVVLSVIIGGWAFFLRDNEEVSQLSAAENNENGIEALNAGDFQSAIQSFEAAIQADPAYAATYANLGLVYEVQGDESLAQENYREALNYDSQLFSPRYRLVGIILDSGDVEEALSLLTEGLAVLQSPNVQLSQPVHDSAQFQMYSSLGRAYFLRGAPGDLDIAKTELTRALQYEDVVDYPAEAYYYLALVAERLDEPEDANDAWCNLFAKHNPANMRHIEWATTAQARCEFGD